MRLVLVGPSGCGKTAVGRALADALGWAFLDADDLHAPEARAKMASGVPLTDADRAPWLARVRAAMLEHERVVVACSALKRAYRDQLPGRQFLLDAPRDVLLARVTARTGHFMPASLLDSQLATLERDGVELIDATRPIADVVAELVHRVPRSSPA